MKTRILNAECNGFKASCKSRKLWCKSNEDLEWYMNAIYNSHVKRHGERGYMTYFKSLMKNGDLKSVQISKIKEAI